MCRQASFRLSFEKDAKSSNHRQIQHTSPVFLRSPPKPVDVGSLPEEFSDVREELCWVGRPCQVKAIKPSAG
jgi:hypothetical protein